MSDKALFEEVKVEDLRAGDSIVVSYPRLDPSNPTTSTVIDQYPYFSFKGDLRTSVHENRTLLLLNKEGGSHGNQYPKNYVFKRMLKPDVVAMNINRVTYNTLLRFSKGSTGTDPEFFVAKNEQLLPAFEFLPKETPSNSTGFWDGFQAEFRTAPHTCHEIQASRIMLGIHDILSKATAEALLEEEIGLIRNSTVSLSEEQYQNTPPEFLELGCRPSLNAYNMDADLTNAQAAPYRWAGGHIHRAIDPSKQGNSEYIANIIRAIDRTLGVISVALARDLDSPIRRQFYGLAGEYRVTSYGFEYRTLSNFWCLAPQLVHLVLDLFRFYAGSAMLLPHSSWNITEEEATQIINTSDVERAVARLKENETELRKHIGFVYPNMPVGDVQRTCAFIYHGAQAYLKFVPVGWEKQYWDFKYHRDEEGRLQVWMSDGGSDLGRKRNWSSYGVKQIKLTP